MCRRRMKHLRCTAFIAQTRFSLTPWRACRSVLRPVRKRGLIAPGFQFRHCRKMGAAHHEGARRSLITPDRQRPESTLVIARDRHETAVARLRLAVTPKRVAEKKQKIPVGAKAQPRDRHVRHGAYATKCVPMGPRSLSSSSKRSVNCIMTAPPSSSASISVMARR